MPSTNHDNQQQDTTRQNAPSVDFSLSVEEVATLFESGKVPRSARTISRYCENGYLDCTKIETDRNTKYLISPASTQRRIGELQSIMVASRSSPVIATASLNLNQQDNSNYHDTTRHDESLDDNQSSGNAAVPLHQKIAQLELENHELKIENHGLKTSREHDKIYMERIEKQNDSLFEIVSSFNDKFFATMNMVSKMLHAPRPNAEPVAQPETLNAPEEPSQTNNPISLN